ncbi:hypothetical protein LCGC14_0431070 [marine sediment metagenome]|uniref:Uncharacterized protein n=1 Tax=marine sediment metagenome TaxID=412755 RepID=A0A0F9T6A1_9ZZZZ
MGIGMASAPMGRQHIPVGRIKGTGIRLKVVDRKTGKQVNYGVQFNNTTSEIEALPDLIVTMEQK